MTTPIDHSENCFSPPLLFILTGIQILCLITLSQDVDKTLHIKGQMIYIKEWQQMLFLACPIMKGLNNLIWSGLFINDLRFVEI